MTTTNLERTALSASKPLLLLALMTGFAASSSGQCPDGLYAQLGREPKPNAHLLYWRFLDFAFEERSVLAGDCDGCGLDYAIYNWKREAVLSSDDHALQMQYGRGLYRIDLGKMPVSKQETGAPYTLEVADENGTVRVLTFKVLSWEGYDADSDEISLSLSGDLVEETCLTVDPGHPDHSFSLEVALDVSGGSPPYLLEWSFYRFNTSIGEPQESFYISEVDPSLPESVVAMEGLGRLFGYLQLYVTAQVTDACGQTQVYTQVYEGNELCNEGSGGWLHVNVTGDPSAGGE